MFHKNLLTDYTLNQNLKLYQEKGHREVSYSSFDFETTGLNVYKGAQAFSMAICYPDMTKVIIDFKKDRNGNYKKDRKNWNKVQDYFNDTSLGKVAHNLLFEKTLLKAHGIKVPKDTLFQDSMIAHQMLRNDHPSHALDYLAWEYGNWSRELDKKVKAIGTVIGYQNVSKLLMHPYQHADVERCLLIFNSIYPRLCADEKLFKDYLNELLLLDTTENMQSTGLCLNIEKAHELLRTIEQWLIDTQEKTKKLYGKYYNLNSTPPLYYLLFERLQLPILNFTKGGKPKVDKTILFQYKEKYIDYNTIDPEKYEVLNLIFKTRSYIKGIANIKSYMKFAGKEGRLHCSTKTNHAKTGRQSTENPNTQNIQKEKNANVPFPIPARSIYCAPSGYIYYLVDYAGIEMRLIVENVNETAMLDIINHGNGDIHAPVAELFFKDVYTLEKDLTEKASIRSKAKNLNFAFPYGVGIDKAFSMLSPYVRTLQETQEKIDLYAKTYPKVFNFSSVCEEQVKKYGYVETAFGRKLYLNRRDAYMGGNYKIQGTAAQILKRGENRLHRYYTEYWNNLIKLVITIHDELIIQVPIQLEQYESTFLYESSKILTSFDEIQVRLDVEWKKTKTSWADAFKFDYKKLKYRIYQPSMALLSTS